MMADEVILKPALEDQIPVFRDIYNYYLEKTTYTFQITRATPEDLRGTLFYTDPRFGGFGVYTRGQLAGYAILARYSRREAYDCTAEITIYLAPGFCGKGLGPRVLSLLEEKAREREFHTLIGIISVENGPSIKLFTQGGYEKCAHFKEVGKKFGRYVDVVIYQKILPPRG